MLTSNCTACILELSSFISINSSVKGELGLREIYAQSNGVIIL